MDRRRKDTGNGWREGLRLALSTVWVVALSFWTFYLALWFYSWETSRYNALYGASAILRAIPLLWYSSFFPALAFGIAWHVFTHRLRASRTMESPSGLTRFTIAQTYGSLCIPICWFVVNVRTLPLLPLVGLTNASEPMLAATRPWGAENFRIIGTTLDLYAWTGVLVAALAAIQAWGILPGLGESRRRLLTWVGLLLVIGLSLPYSGGLNRLPSPVPPGLFVLKLETATERGLLFGDPDHRAEAELALARYITTHRDDGPTTPLRSLRSFWFPDWPVPAGSDSVQLFHYRACELCFVPGVNLWTRTGLPMRLDDRPPTDHEPTLVIEIPRAAVHARVYDPRDPASMTRLPIADLQPVGRSADWVVAKIDFAVPMKTVVSTLEELRDHGVRRVDLAVVPYGFRPLPSPSYDLSFDGSGSTPIFRPRERNEPETGRPAIVVRKFRPPSPEQPLACPFVDEREYDHAWARYALEPPGSLPERIALSTRPDTRYGEFVGALQSALTGGTESIVVRLTSQAE